MTELQQADEILERLGSDERQLLREIEELQADLEAVRRYKRRLLSKKQLEIIPRSLSTPNGKPVGAQKAVEIIINSQTSRQWTPKEIKRQLEIMIKSGQVNMKKNAKTPLITVVHGILSRLYDKGNGSITRGGEPGNRWYGKKVQLEVGHGEVG